MAGPSSSGRFSVLARTGREEEAIVDLQHLDGELAREPLGRRARRGVVQHQDAGPVAVYESTPGAWNMFAKLGVASRIELARAVERADRAASS